MKVSQRRTGLSVLCVAALAVGGIVFTTHRSRGAEADETGATSKRRAAKDTFRLKDTPTKIEFTAQKRLLLSAQASAEFRPVLTNRVSAAQSLDGEIWLTISYDDGSPFTQAKASDIRLETLRSVHEGEARLDLSQSRPADGVWHFVLPQLAQGNHFYRLKVESNVAAWKTIYEGQTIVRATYTRMPYWNAQRFDGTIWDPPH